LRVLREGHLRAGDSVVKIAAGPPQISVSSVDALLYLPGGDVDTMRRVLRVDALSTGLRGSLRDLADRADHPHPSGAPRREPAGKVSGACASRGLLARPSS
jgi:hypothetical protein